MTKENGYSLGLLFFPLLGLFYILELTKMILKAALTSMNVTPQFDAFLKVFSPNLTWGSMR